MTGTKKPKPWSVARAARLARDARLTTARFLGEAPIARQWQASKLAAAYQAKLDHLGAQHRREAAALLLTGLGYPESWAPESWMDAAGQVLTDVSGNLTGADLYVLSPQMCDAVVAAAQTLTLDDLSLLSVDDLPSPSGLLLLPQPLMVTSINGASGDERAYQWHTPMQMPLVPEGKRQWEHHSAVRLSVYHDTHGPVQPDSFRDLARQAHVKEPRCRR